MRSFAPLCIATVLGAGSIAACSGAGNDDLGLGSTSTNTTTSGGVGGDGSGGQGSVPEKPVKPAAGGIRRLLAKQYVNSVRAVFGDVAALEAKPPEDTALHGFQAIGAAELALPEAAIEAYEQSARDIATAVVEDQATMMELLPCVPTGPTDEACQRAFITDVGKVAWRRPLETSEIDLLANIAKAASAEYDTFEAGIAYAISGLLQSPYFLYMVEVGTPSPTDTDPTRRALTNYELASRMSFFLLDTTPDLPLIESAETGALDTDEGIRAAAQKMVADPAARSALAAFYTELFMLSDIGTISKDASVFPQFNAALADAMGRETLELINEIVWNKNGDAREMFTADYAFVNAALAPLYGVAAPPTGFQKVTLPAAHKRSGFLGSAGFLARFAHPAVTSPTRRGHFIKEILLCEIVPPPPPGVVAQFPPDDPAQPKTAKMKLENHMKDPNCATCHKQMDPIGYALENYDALGIYRTTDQGLPIDPSGTVDGIGTFSSAKEIGAILHDDPRGASCIIRNIFRNSMGHLETKGELPAIAKLEKSFGASGYRIQDLLVELVANPAFQLVGEPK